MKRELKPGPKESIELNYWNQCLKGDIQKENYSVSHMSYWAVKYG